MGHSEHSHDSKLALRAELRRARAALSSELWRASSAAIVEHLKGYFEANPASRVALYAPLEARREVDLRALDGWLRARGAQVAYPILRKSVVGFAWVPSLSALTLRDKFPEPDATCPMLAPGELDVIVAPALAATPSGYRLGYGSGFYDRVLGAHCPPATALCVVFESQMRTQLPIAAHDVRCHAVVTERGVEPALEG